MLVVITLREKLKQIGAGNKVTVIAQQQKSGLLINIRDFNTCEYLTDHIWYKPPCYINRMNGDYFIFDGVIHAYNKYYEVYGVDYNIYSIKLHYQIHEIAYKDVLYYMLFDKWYSYWFKRGGYQGNNIYSIHKLEELSIEYEIVGENENKLVLEYREKSNIIVIYKNLDKLLKSLGYGGKKNGTIQK